MPEIPPSPEQIQPTSEFIGLQARFLQGKEALNPRSSVQTVTKESLGHAQTLEEQIDKREYSPFSNASTNERTEYWLKNSESFDVKKEQWADGLITTFANSKSYFTTQEEGKQRSAVYKKLGIDTAQFTKEDANTLYNKYFSENSSQSNIKQFAKDVTSLYKTADNSLDVAALKRDLPGIKWLANIFGNTSSEVILQLISAEVNLQTAPEAIINQALVPEKASDGTDSTRVNNLRPKEIELLEFVSRTNLQKQPSTSTPAKSSKPSQNDQEPAETPEEEEEIPQPDSANEESKKVVPPQTLERKRFEKQLEGIKALTPAEVATKKAELSAELLKSLDPSKPSDAYVKEMLESSHEAAKPVTKITIEGNTFYFTSAFVSAGDRSIAVAYTKSGDTFVPRLFYKSKSAGGWRSTPGREGGRFKKGGKNETDPLKSHYVQETKPVQEIIDVLDALTQNKATTFDDWTSYSYLENKFAITANGLPQEAQTYDAEVKLFQESLGSSNGPFAEIVHFAPGHYAQIHGPRGILTSYEQKFGKRAQSISDVFNSWDEAFFNSPELKGFLPDFTHVKAEFDGQHTLLGDIHLRAFQTSWQGQNIEWVMANDKDGRVWIDRISLADSPINSYGTKAEFINSGALTNKPLEYADQALGLRPDEKRGFPHAPSYTDITPLLDQLLPIQKYRQQFNIARGATLPQAA